MTPARTATLFFFLLLFLPASLRAATFQERMEAAVSAFRAGDYAAAHWQFEALELDFGTAPEFRDRGFREMVLPLRAYAALMADRPTGALVYFHRILTEFRPSDGLRAFCFYNAALAQERCGALEAAARTYSVFRTSFADSPEAGLALLREADLRHRLGDSEEAGALLEAFYASEAPATLRLQGRLRALQIAVETEQAGRSREILFETPWKVESMPDVAVLSFAAIEVGDLLVREGQHEAAVRAYRHALPLEILSEKQAERLAGEEARLRNAPSWAGAIWKSHAAQLVKRLRRQLEQLRTMPDYTPGLYLRFGQAFLLSGRYREAVLLFRTVAAGDGFEPELRAQAHYRWVVALCEAADWESARETAHQFLTDYPGHALAPDALFLVAHAFQGEGRSAEAVEVLDRLIDSYPDARGAARWYFVRGYNHCVLEAYGDARTSFRAVIDNFPGSRLSGKCRLWHGLSRFFERDYAASLAELETLREDARGRPVEAEATYRIANVRYALRDYEGTLRETGILLEAFPGHHRTAEARALRGDALMGLGELTEAAAAFRQVPADEGRLFDYAVFQAAKIYRALDRPDLLRTHLRGYIARDDAAARPRVSEALFWIGRSLREEGRIEEAFPLFEEALDRFGNDPEASAVGSILRAFAELHGRKREAAASAPGLEADLGARLDAALREDRLTWFARLTLFLAERRRARLGDAARDAALLSIHRLVPLEHQDADCLAAVGVVLAERGYRSADDYFEALLTHHADHPGRAAAFYGKALLASENGHLEKARRWLLRFLEETPTHPLTAEARLLAARVLERQGRPEDARAALEEILEIKSLRGRAHARALCAFARLETNEGRPRRAVAYWQRVYTLYRAYPDLLAEAYWQSARLFEDLGDLRAAHDTLLEMEADRRLEASAEYSQVREKLAELRQRLPSSEFAAQSGTPPSP